MADQDFNITIKTVADTTGIKLTEQGLNSIKVAALQGNQEAIAAMKNLTAAQREASAGLSSGFGAGAFTGIGTIATLLTFATNRILRFSEEQDKILEKMSAMTEKSHELGLSVADAIEEFDFKKLLDTAPLDASFGILTQKVTRLREQMQQAFNSGNYQDAEKNLRLLQVTESQLDNIINKRKRAADEAEREADAASKAAEASAREAATFMEHAVASSSPQVQQTLLQEDAARRAGLGTRESDQYLRSAEQLKAGMTQAQREEYEGLQSGGSQRVIDAINDLRRDLVGIWR